MAEEDETELSPILDVPEVAPVDPAQAKAEEEFLSQDKGSEELRQIAARRDHNRDQQFKDAFEQIAILALRILAVALLICGIAWLSNLVLPTACRWLDCDQMAKLQDILTGGLLAGLLGDHFRHRLK